MTIEKPHKDIPSRASAKAQISPPAGWKVQSEYGTLRTRASVDLVRLEDVHAWMVDQGIPPHDAVYKVFGPFHEACQRLSEGGGAEPIIDALYVANALTYPDGLFKSNKPSQGNAPRHWASAFPDLGYASFSDGPGVLIHAMGEGALRVWHGGANIHTDHLAVLKDRRDREGDAEYSIVWPSDDDLRLLLGRLAAPFETAHALWAYGAVPVVIEPAEGWTLESPLGLHMAFNSTPSGRLVRLADLLRWLEKTRSLPRVAAVKVLCDAMPLDAMSWLYRLQMGRYAEPVAMDAQFGYQTAAQIEAATARARAEAMHRASERFATNWDGFRNRGMYVEAGKISAGSPEPTEPGRPSLLRRIRWDAGLIKHRKAECEPIDDVRSQFTFLAIPVSKAHLLWGYGTATQTGAEALEIASPNDWTAAAVEKLRAEIEGYDRQHRRGGKADAARRYKVTPQRITELLKPKASKASSPFSGLGGRSPKAA